MFFSVKDVRQLTTNYKAPFSFVWLFSAGLWLVLEYIEYARKKTSLLKDVLHEYEIPVLSVLVGSFILAVFMELQDIPVGLWLYTNLPPGDVKFLGLPIFVYLSWPIHYIFFLSLFRAFTDKESAEIWRGDLIP